MQRPLAPAMYQRMAPGFEFGFSPEDIGYSPEAYRLGLQYYQQVTPFPLKDQETSEKM